MTSQLQLTDRVITVDIDKETIDFGSRRIILGEKGLQGWHGGAEVLRNNRQRLGSHGIFSERGWRGAALVTVTGWLETDSRALATEAVDDLSEFLADGKDGRIVVRDKDFGNRYSVCYLNGAPDIEWLPGPHERVHVKFSYDLVCTDPRHYEEDVVSDVTGLAQPGGGLRFPLFARGEPEVLRRNLIGNPSFETGLGGWILTGLTATSTSAFPQMAKLGTNIAQMISNGTVTQPALRWDDVPVSPGQWVGARAFLASEVAGDIRVRIVLEFLDAANAAVSAVGTTYARAPFYTGAVHELTAQVPATATKMRFYMRFQNGAAPSSAVASGVRMWADAIMAVDGLEEADVQANLALGYFDGSKLATGTEAYRWAGEPHLSVSEAVTPVVPSAGVLDFGILGEDGIATITNAGNADTTVLVSVAGPAPQGFTATEISTGRKLTYVGALGNGDYVELDSSDGTVLLNGYADRGTLLTVRDWFTLDKRQTSSYKIEAPSGSPVMTVSASPAWW